MFLQLVIEMYFPENERNDLNKFLENLESLHNRIRSGERMDMKKVGQTEAEDRLWARVTTFLVFQVLDKFDWAGTFEAICAQLVTKARRQEGGELESIRNELLEILKNYYGLKSFSFSE